MEFICRTRSLVAAKELATKSHIALITAFQKLNFALEVE
jgi:hypothetical protein